MFRRTRLLSSLLAVAAASSTLALMPGQALADSPAAVVGDVFRDSNLAYASAYDLLPPGPEVAAPMVAVDAGARTVTLTLSEVGHARSSITLAWPLRVGSWQVGLDGTAPEQRVRLQRGAGDCTVTSGTLVVTEATRSADGGVASLAADLRQGSCALSNEHRGYAGLSVRVGTSAPLPGAGRAAPRAIDTGALEGTRLSRTIDVTNAGGSDWRIRAVGTGSWRSHTARFAVTSDTCTGTSLPVGGACSVTVATTATTESLYEHLIVAGDGAADLVVPLRLEGYRAVPVPTGLTALPGRTGVTLTWDAPASDPQEGYRVYDTSGGGRVPVATAPRTARSLRVPGSGPRSLALVAADGRYAESPHAAVDVPAVPSELIALDPYGVAVGFDTTAAGPRHGRPTLLHRHRAALDPARSAWLTADSSVQVCRADTDGCTTVSEEGGEATWLPDGRIALLTGTTWGARALKVLARTGETSSHPVPVGKPDDSCGQLAAAPDGLHVLVHCTGQGIVRLHLATGVPTVVPGTADTDAFTVTTTGRLVTEQRRDVTASTGSRLIRVRSLDGSNVTDLPLPDGDVRSVTFDPSEKQVAYVQHTGEYQGTVWTAAADGTDRRRLSGDVRSWRGLVWSVDDVAAPMTRISGAAVTGPRALLTVAASDADDPVGSLRRECRVDGAAWMPCGSTWAPGPLTGGRHTADARTTDASGKAGTASWSWTVDPAALPSATLAGLAAVHTTDRPTLTWSASASGGATIGSYDVRARRAPPSGRWESATSPAAWQRLTAARLAPQLVRGYQYCFSVRARDRAGNVGPYGGERCTSVALDDRALSASAGWTRGTGASYAAGTWTGARRAGASLTLGSVQSRRLAVVALTCSTCGALDAYQGGVRLGRVSLQAPATRYRQVLWLPLQRSPRGGTVTLRTVDSRLVSVDGLAMQQ